MPNVSFIRHYKLTAPFDKKETIEKDQCIRLSKGEVDPSVNLDIVSYISENFQREGFLIYDLILVSPTRRTIESAKYLKQHFSLSTPLEVTKLLGECVWDPALEGTRIQRFIDGSDLSNISDTWARLQILDKYLKSLKSQNVLCITHSFLIQLLYLYYIRSMKDYKTITENDIKNSYHAEYLKGFTYSF